MPSGSWARFSHPPARSAWLRWCSVARDNDPGAGSSPRGERRSRTRCAVRRHVGGPTDLAPSCSASARQPGSDMHRGHLALVLHSRPTSRRSGLVTQFLGVSFLPLDLDAAGLVAPRRTGLVGRVDVNPDAPVRLFACFPRPMNGGCKPKCTKPTAGRGASTSVIAPRCLALEPVRVPDSLGRPGRISFVLARGRVMGSCRPAARRPWQSRRHRYPATNPRRGSFVRYSSFFHSSTISAG